MRDRTTQSIVYGLCIVLIMLISVKGHAITINTDDMWASVADMPTARASFPVAVVDDKIYALGGLQQKHDRFYRVDVVEMYNPADNTWTTRAPMPTTRGEHAAVVVNKRIYAIGGLFASCSVFQECGDEWTSSPTVEVYNPVDNMWTTRTPMPTARTGLAGAAAEGRIYAIGGISGFFESNKTVFATVEEYNPADDTWVTRAPMPTARTGLTAVTVGGRIYALGGNANGDFSVVEMYDPKTDMWHSRAPIPTKREGFAAVAMGGRIYVIGGFAYGKELATVEEYNPADDTWITRAPMPTSRRNLAAAMVGGKIYAIGGVVGTAQTAMKGDPLSTMEEYDPPPYDTDSDGLADDDELGIYGTDPLVQDASTDTDGDGLSNVEEIDTHHTNYTNVDTDGDGIEDGDEVETGTNPLDASDPPTETISVPEFPLNVELIVILVLVGWNKRRHS